MSDIHTAPKPLPPSTRRGVFRAVYEELALRRARRGARRLVRRLGLRPHDGLQQLVDAVARRRGRRIIIREAPLRPDVTGLCMETKVADIIVIDTSATTPLLRLVILLHELRHLLNDTGGRGQRAVSAAAGKLTRWGLWSPRPAIARDPDHTLVAPGTLADLTPSLPADLVQELFERRHPVHMRSPRHSRLDIAEVWAKEVITMLALDDDPAGTGAITSSLDHRRTGI